MARVKISFLEPLDPLWTTMTFDHPEATIFNHPSWMELLKTCYGYKSVLFSVLSESGQPVAALPLLIINSWLTGQRYVSLPFSDFCQPLALNDASLRDLTEELQLWRQKNKVNQILIHWPLPSMDGVYPAETFVRHLTHLNPESQQVFNSFAKTQIQQRIRKAERDGVRIRRSEEWEDLRLFYGLHLETRRRLGTPIQPLRFFKLLWERLISQGLGFVLLAYKESQLLSGAVFLHCNTTLTYKYSASNPAFLKLRPNNLLLWYAIQWGCQYEYQIFDWGRTELDNAGLREFKRGWGSEEQYLHYSVLADRPPKPLVVGTASRLLTPLIQHSPTWVCRAIGELFYKHFG